MTDKSKINNLKTKTLPPLFMMCGGTVALAVCLVQRQPLLRMLIVLFLALLSFAILGTIVKSIVDKFNMTMKYSDFLRKPAIWLKKGRIWIKR